MNNQFTLLYNNIEDVYRACLDSVNRMPLSKIISENYGTKTIVIGFSGSLFSKGEEITVSLEPINNNQTKLVFKSNIVESNSMMPKQNKNIEKIKVVLPTLLPKPIIEDTLPKREMPQVTMEPINNEEQVVQETPVVEQPTYQEDSFLNNYQQTEVKPISNEPSDSSKVKEDYDPLGDFMNKI